MAFLWDILQAVIAGLIIDQIRKWRDR